jgi:hypothetical protein
MTISDLDRLTPPPCTDACPVCGSDQVHGQACIATRLFRTITRLGNRGMRGSEIARASGKPKEKLTDVTRPLQCAGLNRHEAEDESSLRERSSDPLGLESCAGYREVHSEA